MLFESFWPPFSFNTRDIVWREVKRVKELRTPSGKLAGKYGFNEGHVILEIRFKRNHGVRIRIGLDGITAEDI